MLLFTYQLLDFCATYNRQPAVYKCYCSRINCLTSVQLITDNWQCAKLLACKQLQMATQLLHRNLIRWRVIILEIIFAHNMPTKVGHFHTANYVYIALQASYQAFSSFSITNFSNISQPSSSQLRQISEVTQTIHYWNDTINKYDIMKKLYFQSGE